MFQCVNLLYYTSVSQGPEVQKSDSAQVAAISDPSGYFIKLLMLAINQPKFKYTSSCVRLCVIRVLNLSRVDLIEWQFLIALRMLCKAGHHIFGIYNLKCEFPYFE